MQATDPVPESVAVPEPDNPLFRDCPERKSVDEQWAGAARILAAFALVKDSRGRAAMKALWHIRAAKGDE